MSSNPSYNSEVTLTETVTLGDLKPKTEDSRQKEENEQNIIT